MGGFTYLHICTTNSTFKALVCMDFQFLPQLLAYKVKKYDWNRKCSKWDCKNKNNKCTFLKGGSLKLLNKMFGGIFIFVTLQKKYLKSRGKSLEEMSFERTTFATFASIRVHMWWIKLSSHILPLSYRISPHPSSHDLISVLKGNTFDNQGFSLKDDHFKGF